MRKNIQYSLVFLVLVNVTFSGRDRSVTGFSEGLAKVQVKSKWGFINYRGKLMIPPKFESVGDFFGGYASVKKEKQSHLIDTHGNIVLKRPHIPFYRYYTSTPLIHFCVSGGDKVAKWGFKDTQGNVVISPQFDSATEFHEGLASVGKGTSYKTRKKGFINPFGQIVISPQFEVAIKFSEGLAKVILGGKTLFYR